MQGGTMSSRQPPGDLGHMLPFVKHARAKLNELQANDEKQAAKLSEHDKALGALHQDLMTLNNLLDIRAEALDAESKKTREQLRAVDAVLKSLKERLNGH
jgi:chromosome segregation ATPase